ncbi:MAG: DUF1273 domain-containing protein [Clostridiales bacterium]|nr:DUF1273 domain-containing protein [Clostridiales bacterium]
MTKPDRLRRCCFTGHRPQKLVRREEEIKDSLEREILRAVADGFDTFITGMAQGVDLWAGEIILRLRQENPGLGLIAALPYPDCERHWTAPWRRLFAQVLKGADQVVCLSPRYSRAVYLKRDQWMVDQSARVIAVYEGAPGGTQDTIAHAKEKGVEIKYA